MKVLVVGGGAREHSILWKLAQSPRNPGLFAAPGNAGTTPIATNLPIAVTDLNGLAAAAQRARHRPHHRRAGTAAHRRHR